jgi:hypothetical protein
MQTLEIVGSAPSPPHHPAPSPPLARILTPITKAPPQLVIQTATLLCLIFYGLPKSQIPVGLSPEETRVVVNHRVLELNRELALYQDNAGTAWVPTSDPAAQLTNDLSVRVVGMTDFAAAGVVGRFHGDWRHRSQQLRQNLPIGRLSVSSYIH